MKCTSQTKELWEVEMSKHIEHIAEKAIKTKLHFKNSTFIGGLLPTLLATVVLFAITIAVGGPEHLPS